MREGHPSEGAEGEGRTYFVRGREIRAPALAPALYLVATPIGHLDDVTLRALDTLAGADLVACEDTRVTRKLLSRYGVATALTAYHEHSGPAARRRLLTALDDGKAVALVSDAGTPLISDPGFRLVQEAVAAGHRVVPVPGPSSVMAALAGAALPTDAFLFAGFLPPKTTARRKRLKALAAIPATLVLLEAPGRVGAMLADAAGELGGDRPAALCREMTKLFETFERGTLAELADRFAGDPPKGEIVVVIAPPGEAAEAPEAAEIETRLRRALAELGVRDAAERVAAETGLKRRDLYRRALALKGDGDDG